MEKQVPETAQPKISQSTSVSHSPFLGAAADSEPEHLSLEQYASLKNISIEAAWTQVQRGQVLARFKDDELSIFLQEAPRLNYSAPKPSQNMLMPLPQSNHRQQNQIVSNSPSELSLLIDHLSLAKEENLELIRFTQSTLTEMRQTYEAGAKLKEQAIAEAKTQTQLAEEKLAKALMDIENLKQQIEDLKMLEKIKLNT